MATAPPWAMSQAPRYCACSHRPAARDHAAGRVAERGSRARRCARAPGRRAAARSRSGSGRAPAARWWRRARRGGPAVRAGGEHLALRSVVGGVSGDGGLQSGSGKQQRGNTHGPGCLDGEAPNLRGIASGFHRAVLRGMRMARCSNGRSSGAAINRNRPATAFRGKLRCRGRNFPDDVVFNALPSEWRCKSRR